MAAGSVIGLDQPDAMADHPLRSTSGIHRYFRGVDRAMPEATGEQIGLLSEGIRSAFPLRRLEELLLFRLNRRLDDIAFGDDYREVVFRVLTTANAEGWLSRLIVAARLSNPGNADLEAAAAAIGLSSTAGEEGNLERLVRERAGFFDVASWRSSLGATENRVCRIDVAGSRASMVGTGFLIGPKAVITNHHVVEMVIDAERRQAAGKAWASPTDVTVTFDFKLAADGRTLDQGISIGLDADWLIDSSPLSAADFEQDPKTTQPSSHELDHAVLRLAEPFGSRPAGRSPEPSAEPRGWIDLAAAGPAPEVASPMFILQHPAARPLKLAVGAIIGPNGNGTRLKYSAITLPGSSGSPCFDESWRLVALHHSGDPNFTPGHQPAYNEGIPINLIAARLTGDPSVAAALKA